MAQLELYILTETRASTCDPFVNYFPRGSAPYNVLYAEGPLERGTYF